MKQVLLAFAIVIIGPGLALTGIYFGQVDDAPDAALIGMLLMIGCTARAARVATREIAPTSFGASRRAHSDPIRIINS